MLELRIKCMRFENIHCQLGLFDPHMKPTK